MDGRRAIQATADSYAYVKHAAAVSRSPRHRHPRQIRLGGKNRPRRRCANRHVVFHWNLASAGTIRSHRQDLRFGDIRAPGETLGDPLAIPWQFLIRNRARWCPAGAGETRPPHSHRAQDFGCEPSSEREGYTARIAVLKKGCLAGEGTRGPVFRPRLAGRPCRAICAGARRRGSEASGCRSNGWNRPGRRPSPCFGNTGNNNGREIELSDFSGACGRKIPALWHGWLLSWNESELIRASPGLSVGHLAVETPDGRGTGFGPAGRCGLCEERDERPAF